MPPRTPKTDNNANKSNDDIIMAKDAENRQRHNERPPQPGTAEFRLAKMQAEWTPRKRSYPQVLNQTYEKEKAKKGDSDDNMRTDADSDSDNDSDGD